MKMDATEACTICQNCGQPSNWTHDDGGCPRCGKPRGTPPIAAPAAHVERRKGQVEVGQLWRAGSKQHRVTSVDGEYVTTDVGGDTRFHGPTMLTYWTLLSDATPEPAKSCVCPHGPSTTNGKCPVHVTAGIPVSGFADCACAKCVPPAQEAPKAAPVCSAFSPTLHGPCAGNLLERARYNGQRLLCDRHYLAFETRDFEAMNDETKPTGILRDPDIGERLPRPQLAADWVEDCLPESGR